MNDKPSSIVAGLGLGVATACVILLGAYVVGYFPPFPAWLGVFVALFGAGFGLVPFWEWATYETDKNETVYANTSPAPLPTIEHAAVNGVGAGAFHRYRATTQNEADWIDAECDFLLWARKLSTLASTKHVGVSVKTPNDWQELTDRLVDHDAVLKHNGVETRFAPEWDSTRAFNAVMNGWVQFPDRPAPHVVPFPAGRQTIDANVPDKARAAEAA